MDLVIYLNTSYMLIQEFAPNAAVIGFACAQCGLICEVYIVGLIADLSCA